MPGNEALAASLARESRLQTTEIAVHGFPDGETLVRFPSALSGQSLAIVCTLDRPNAKILPLLFAAATARELGARSVGLIAPYLCYMRQDRRFHPGEAVSARLFASLLSRSFDWLVTVEPHLHRIGGLGDIFSIPAQNASAGSAIAQWIKREVPNPYLIGPDAESEQWVKQVAATVGCPHETLTKRREGDRAVSVSALESSVASRTPVILDDIVSTGQTALKTVEELKRLQAPPPVIVGVHGLFEKDAYEKLSAAASRLVTTNTIAHKSNEIDITPSIVRALSAVPF